jgi:hypothetical protein
MRAFIKEFRQRLFFRAPYGNSVAVDDLSDIRIRVVHIADKNRLRRTNDYTCGFELHVDAVRAEVTLLSRMVFWIDKDGVVGARSHACLTANADRLVKIDNAIGPLEHRRRRAGGDAGSVSALIAARYLMYAAGLRKDTDIDVLDVSARDR